MSITDQEDIPSGMTWSLRYAPHFSCRRNGSSSFMVYQKRPGRDADFSDGADILGVEGVILLDQYARSCGGKKA